MAVEFRPAGPGDQDGIAALWYDANRGSPGWTTDQPGRPRAPQLTPRRRFEAFGFVAEDTNSIIGSAVLIPARFDRGAGDVMPGLGHLNSVAVAPDHWGEGIARTLLDLVVDEARGTRLTRCASSSSPRTTTPEHEDLDERNGWNLTGEEVIDDLGDTLVRFLREL